jgi:hypothetical protein
LGAVLNPYPFMFTGRVVVQLNFKETNEFGDFKMKQLHNNYGYNLQETLAKYPIQEMENELTRKSLMQSLEKGNREPVTFIAHGEGKKAFVDASPQFKSVNFYDESMKRVNAQTLSENVGQSEKKESQKQEQKKGMSGEGEEGGERKLRGKKKGHRMA